MKRIIFFAFIFLFGLLQAQTKSKGSTTKKKAEKEWVNPVKLTKEERNRPYMDEVLKTRDSLTPKEAERRRKNIAIGNPFAKEGYYPKIATLSRGKYLEFHDKDSIVSIGSIKYNTKQKKVIEFVEEDLSNPDRQPLGDTHGMWMSPDPLSEEFPSWSPYNFVFSNPIRNIDPTGMAPQDIIFGKNISQEAQNKIVNDLQKLTGLQLSVNESGKLSYTQSANQSGSESARNMLMGAIDNHRTEYQINSDNTRGSSIQSLTGRGEVIDGVYGSTTVFDLNINTNQIDSFIKGTSEALNPLTKGYGMVTLHEVSHKYNNLIDGFVGSDGKQYGAEFIYGMPGDNVKFMNKIRNELDSSKSFTLPFGERKSYSPNGTFYPFSQDSFNKGLQKVDPKKDLYINAKKDE